MLKITVKQDLGKWFGRASAAASATDPAPVSLAECYTAGGYKMRVNVASHIFGNNEDEAWYDRLLTAPWDDEANIDRTLDAVVPGTAATDDTYEPVADVTAETGDVYVEEDGAYRLATAAERTDTTLAFYKKTAEAAPATAEKKPFNASAYYQIYDVDVYEGNAALRSRRQNVQPYGMDYSWTLISPGRLGVHAPLYGEFYGSPNFPAINGYTVMNNSVVTDEVAAASEDQKAFKNLGLKVTDTDQVNYNDALKGGVTLYAQAGTHAVMRKPFVRVWTPCPSSCPRWGRLPMPSRPTTTPTTLIPRRIAAR